MFESWPLKQKRVVAPSLPELHRESGGCRAFLYHRYYSSCKAWPDTKTKHTTGKSKLKLVSGPIVRVIHQSIGKRHQFENCDYYEVLYGRWTERASLAHSPYKSLLKLQFSNWWHFMVLWSVTLKVGALTKLDLFFSVVCFIPVFDQTLAEQLYRDKGL